MELRLLRGWDEATLARRAGISLKTVQNVEVTTDPCRLDTSTLLAVALRVPVRRLVERQNQTVH
jgi:DNA-binding XRE family transcriptional regulator